MKYMNKMQCIRDGVVKNILQELNMLRQINHPYIVNLRYRAQQGYTGLHRGEQTSAGLYRWYYYFAGLSLP